jgi:hypothetical protein
VGLPEKIKQIEEEMKKTQIAFCLLSDISTTGYY